MEASSSVNGAGGSFRIENDGSSSCCKQIFGNEFLYLTFLVGGILAMLMGYSHLQGIERVVTMGAGGLSLALFVIGRFCCRTSQRLDSNSIDDSRPLAKAQGDASKTGAFLPNTMDTHEKASESSFSRFRTNSIQPPATGMVIPAAPPAIRRTITNDQPLVELLKEAGLSDADTRTFPYIEANDLQLGFRTGNIADIEKLAKMDHVSKDEISIVKTRNSVFTMLYFPKIKMILTSIRTYEKDVCFDYQLSTTHGFQGLSPDYDNAKRRQLKTLIRFNMDPNMPLSREEIDQVSFLFFPSSNLE